MSSAWLVVTPLVIPLTAAIVAMGLRDQSRVQRAAGLIGSGGQLIAGIVLLVIVERSGIQVLAVGGWEAPAGIGLVADRLAAVMVVFGALLGLVCTWYAALVVDDTRTARGHFILSNVLLMGVAGAFLTGDLFNLYVWVEVMLIASFVMLAVGGARSQIEGAVKYVTINLVASAMLLAGVGLVYALTGTLNMADLALRLEAVESRRVVSAAMMLLMVAFGIKAAIFPVFSWLPASYHTPPADVSALFSGLLTKVGVYAIIRTVTLMLPEGTMPSHEMILVVAGFTMVVGVLGALAQLDMRRLLSFHIVSQIGYMLMGLGLASPLALAGAVLYMTQHMVTKTALFLVAGEVERTRGSGWLPSTGGVVTAAPALSGVFAIAALSLAGIPPFAGFVAKFTLARAAIELDAFVIVAIGLAVSALTLLSMSKIWLSFWEPMRSGRLPADAPRFPRHGLAPAGVLAALALALGLLGGPYLDLMMRTAEDAMDRGVYIAAVLGERT